MKSRKLNLFGKFSNVKTTLQGKFIVPPFSVLDARQGYWQRRKRQWMELGIQGELGRNAKAYSCNDGKNKTYDYLPNIITGTSIFDPVLTELMYRWFCPNNGKILDPFAGESVKGIVATCLDYDYTGIELRQEQVDANQKQAKKIGLKPRWIKGDANSINRLLSKRDKYDLIFTSPPYYDLEVYSKQDKDGSAKQTYGEFIEWYYSIFRKVIKHLRKNRFLVVKIGEIRDKKTGAYHNFVGDNISCFLDLGLYYYNEIILVTAIGSLPIRISKQFTSGRKIGKTHQNILVFYKGNPKNIKRKFPQEIINANIT